MDSLDLCNSIRMEFEGVIENKIPLDVFPAKLQDQVAGYGSGIGTARELFH